MEIRKTVPADDPIVVRHYIALWESYGTLPEHFCIGAEGRVLAWIADARKHRRLEIFMAEEQGKALGSASCQIYPVPYPEVIAEEYRFLGYISWVYVEPAFRRRGIAKKLTKNTLEHLEAAGCTHAVLHASEPGRPLYAQMGFERAHEMRLVLRKTHLKTNGIEAIAPPSHSSTADREQRLRHSEPSADD